MEAFRIIALLIALPCLGRAFDCSYIQDQFSCVSLHGCTWPTDKCEGSFLSNCQVPDCYYVDPIDGSDSQNGQVSTPFNSLMPAFQKLSNMTGSVIILNYRSQVEVEILDYTIISSNITVRPLFINNEFLISLANFNISSLPTNQESALTINSGELTLIGCTINSRTSREGLASIFDVRNASLIFQNVSIIGYQGTMPLVVIAADKTTASFTYSGGKHRDSSFWFRLLAGTHIMKDLTIENNKAPDQLIYVGNKLSISNVIVSKGASLLLKLMPWTELNVTNVIVSNYTNGFVSAVQPGPQYILSSRFQDLDLESSTPLIDLQIIPELNSAPPGTFWTNNTIFENITVAKSVYVLNIQDFNRATPTNYAYFAYNVTMRNITKKSIPSASDDIGAVCFWNNGLRMFLYESTFININSHCIFVDKNSLITGSNVFNNSGLEATLLTPDDITNDSQGVSWITASCYNPIPSADHNISSSKFIENKILTRYGGAVRFLGDCTFLAIIENNQFIGNRALYGGAIYSEGPASRFQMANNLYTKNSAISGGAIYKKALKYRVQFNGYTIITQILNNSFDSNTASNKGGAIYLDWDSLILGESTFLNCSAQYGGALYFANLNTIPNRFNWINNNTFISNTATVSGSAMKLLFDFSNMNSSLESIKRIYSCTTLSSPICNLDSSIHSILTNNIDPKNQSISDSKPTAFQFSFYDILLPELAIAGNEDFDLWIHNSTRTRLSGTWSTSDFPRDFRINHKSGHTLSQIILIEVIDQNGQLADFIFNESVSISITATQNNVNDFKASLANGVETLTFNSGRLFIKSVVILGHPNTTATLAIQGLEESLSILKEADLLMNQGIQIYFQPCEIGDVYQPITHTCYTCPEGRYTLLDPYSSLDCIHCDNKRAICPGGSRIAPKPGFWRYSNTSDNIVKCIDEEACLGGLVNDIYNAQGECAFPQQGNLCNECASGYAKFGSSSSCMNCQVDSWYYIKMLSFLLIQLVITLYAVRSNVNKISQLRRSQTEDSVELKEKIQTGAFQSTLLKVAVNFIQSSTVILTFQLEWPDFVDNMIGTTNNILPTAKDGFSIDCVLSLIKGNNKNLYFTHFAVSLVQPFGLWLIIILFYMLYLKVTTQTVFKNPKLKQTSFVLFLIIGFLLQPNIVHSALSLFACRNLNSSENPIHYMIEDTEIRCWTFEHLIWCLAVALPNLIVWAVVFPMILFIKIRTHKKRLQDFKFAAKYSFVIEGLKNKRYNWEFVTFLRKILLIGTSTFFSFLSKKSQTFALFFVISIFTFLQFKYQPYLDQDINRAEFLSLISLSSLGLCGMYFVQEKSEEFGRILFIAVACVSNTIFFAYLALHLAKSYFKVMREFKKKILSTIQNFLNKKDRREEKVEGSILSVNSVPCQSVQEEMEEKIPLPAKVNNAE